MKLITKIISVSCLTIAGASSSLVFAVTPPPLTGVELSKQMDAETEACIQTMDSKRKEIGKTVTPEFSDFSRDMCSCALGKLSDFVAKSDSSSPAFESATNDAVVTCIRGKLVNQVAAEFIKDNKMTEAAIGARCFQYLTDNTNPPDNAKAFWQGFCNCSAPKVITTFNGTSVDPTKVNDVVASCNK